MRHELPKIFLNAPHTSTQLDAATDQWIVIQPRRNQCWLIHPDRWRCRRFDITQEDMINEEEL
jgi:hypothetical protein